MGHSLLTLWFLVITVTAQGATLVVELSKGKSEVFFEAVGRPSMLRIKGKSSKPLEGSLIIANTKLSGSASFDLSSLETGISLRDEHMKTKYLQVEKFPKAVLKFTQLEVPQFGPDEIPFQAELVLHGVTKPVKGTASFTKSGDELEIDAKFDLLISDFAIDQPSFSGITMAKDVKVKVTTKSPLTEKKV